MIKKMEHIGDAVDRAKRSAEATRLAAQTESARAVQASAREVQVLERFAHLMESEQRYRDQQKAALAALENLLSPERREQFLGAAAGALVHAGESGISEFHDLAAMGFLADHKAEIVALIADKTVGCAERQLAALRSEAGDVLAKNNL